MGLSEQVTQRHRERYREALTMRREGAKFREIAAHFGVSQAQASIMVRKGERQSKEPAHVLSVRAANVVARGLVMYGIVPEPTPNERNWRDLERSIENYWNNPYWGDRIDGAIVTPENVAQLSALSISKVTGGGRHTVLEIRAWLAAHGLTLVGEKLGQDGTVDETIKNAIAEVKVARAAERKRRLAELDEAMRVYDDELAMLQAQLGDPTSSRSG